MNKQIDIEDFTSPSFNLELAKKHIELVTDDADMPVCIRLFHDKKDKTKPAIKLFGTIDEHEPAIVSAQAEGYGAFAVINFGGDKDQEITTPRACFVDGDSIPVPGQWHAKPDFLVRRDDTHWHAYWCGYGVPVDRFREVQKRLATYYGTDPSVCNPSRVMRLAGSIHQKGEPAPITLEDLTNGVPPYLHDRRIEDLTAGLPELAETRKSAAGQSTSPDRRTSPAIIEEMLLHIDPGLRRDEAWLTVCGAMVCAPVDDPDWYELGLDLFTRWSRGDFHGGVKPKNFAGVDDCADAWQRDWEKFHG